MLKKKIEVNGFILILLCIVTVSEICFFIFQWNSLNQRLNTLQAALAQSEDERIQVIQEKDILASEKQRLMTEKESLNAELSELNSKLAQLGDMLNQANVDKKAMEGEMERLTKESLGLKDEVRLLEGRISDLGEADQVMESRRRAVTELRKRVRELKNKAQRELDRFRTEAGNHGFVVKEKKSTLIYEKLIQFEQRVRNVDLKKIIVTPSEEQ